MTYNLLCCCRHCAWWDPRDEVIENDWHAGHRARCGRMEDKERKCHALAPRPNSDGRAVWVITTADSFCGQFVQCNGEEFDPR